LIVTELVMNALKHAFPVTRSDSTIDVVYSHSAAGWGLKVSDNGVGKAVTGIATAKGGLGTSIIAALAQQLGAHVDTLSNSSGTSVSISNEPAERSVIWLEHVEPQPLAQTAY
jgi:chemotaxis protein methyltransferase CheR